MTDPVSTGPSPTDVAALVARFAAGGWNELRVESAGVSLLLSASPAAVPLGGTPAPAPVRPRSCPVQTVPVTAPAPKHATARAVAPPVEVDAAWIEVRAPNLGTFYRSPKPGAAPFVEIGQLVSAETEICLLEVMKLFTSVKAGVGGTLRKVCVDDGVLVEGGQVLFLIEAV